MTITRDLVGQFQVIVYIEGQTLAQDPNVSGRLRSALSAKNFFQLPTPQLVAQSDPGRQQLVMTPLWSYAPSDGTRQLVIDSNRLAYAFAGAEKASPTTPSWEEFAKEGSEILGTALEALPRVGYRIAFVAHEIATDRLHRTEGRDLAELGGILLNLGPLSGYERREWGWRVVLRTTGDGESYNLIPDIQRTTGFVLGMPSDALAVRIDVNTVPEATEPRFGPNQLQGAFERLVKLSRQLDDDLDALIGRDRE